MHHNIPFLAGPATGTNDASPTKFIIIIALVVVIGIVYFLMKRRK